MSDLAPTLLPPNAGSIPRALEQAAVRASAIDAANAGLWNPATCPLSVLPWLAWAFAVDVWDSDWAEARKRQVVAASLEVHRRKGTRAALELALASVDRPTTVREWWEATPVAEPYTFSVRMPAAGAALPELATIAAVIAAAKNLRSWLSAITLVASQPAAVAVGAIGFARLRRTLPAKAAA